MPEVRLARETQLSNSYSVRVGDATVTAFLDSYVEFDESIIVHNAEHGAAHVSDWRARQAFVTINCFLVETGSYRVLIDTGVGGAPSASVARIVEELKAYGLAPSDVTHVLFTHLHPDHAGGSITSEASLVFENAEYIANRAERDYWFDENLKLNHPALLEMNAFVQTLKPLEGRFTWVEEGSVLPGIELVHLPGHTPGHSGYRISSGEESLLVWGDITHQPDLQFPFPAVGVSFDSDPALAEKTRRAIMASAAESGELIAGMHLSFPPFGRVVNATGGGFSLIKTVWTPDRRQASAHLIPPPAAQ